MRGSYSDPEIALAQQEKLFVYLSTRFPLLGVTCEDNVAPTQGWIRWSIRELIGDLRKSSRFTEVLWDVVEDASFFKFEDSTSSSAAKIFRSALAPSIESRAVSK